VLSGLVIKGSWFLVVRVWFDVFPNVVTMPSAQLLAGLGAAAIVVANVVALRQERLKLLVAYSTVAQIGYLFLMFPLAFDDAAGALARGAALTGGMLQAISHATAKAAMFMAAGLVYLALGHDRIAGLAGAARALPLSVLTFALAGIALMGLPPSGAYAAKKLFFDAAGSSGQWWWETVLDVGGLLTASYVVLVLAHALGPAAAPLAPKKPVSRTAELAALALAISSLGLGFVADDASPLDALAGMLTFSDLGSAALAVAVGALLAGALARDLPPSMAFLRPLRHATIPVGRMLVGIDGVLRQWPVAGLALIAAAIAFGAAMLARG
jgi:NADH:ubiquinone oxidoreductase subunit 5 (subunit L)/multisubunit Na+/H+ antiporter MnhA subunit